MTDFTSINASVLSALGGQSLTLTRAETGESATFTGIVEPVQPESVQPGSGVYLDCWTSLAELGTLPVRGDEIATATTVYLIVDIDVDAADGVSIRLRKDRDVE